MNSLDVLEFCATVVGFMWALTGCAIWNRWGWCGVRWIWRRRKEIDAAVEANLHSQGFRVVAIEDPHGQ